MRKNSLTPAVRISTTLLINIPSASKLLTSVSAQLQLRAWHHQDMQLNKEALPSGTAVLVKMVERKLG